MLKARIDGSVTVRGLKAVKEYRKQMVYDKNDVHTTIRNMLKSRGIMLLQIFEIELTIFENRETVVRVISMGMLDTHDTKYAFSEIYYTYEKGIKDEKTIVHIYKE